MREVYVIGISTTTFGKLSDWSIKSLTAEAVEKALQDAGVIKEDIGRFNKYPNGDRRVFQDSRCQ